MVLVPEPGESRRERREETLHALRAMENPQTVYEGPRHCQFFPSEPGATKTGATRRQTLRFTRPGEPQTFCFQVAEGNRAGGPVTGRMAWRIFGAEPADQWRFRLNGAETPPEHLRRETRRPGDGVQKDAFLPPHMYFEIDLRHVPSLAFRNALEITPVGLAHSHDTERTMEVLEVWVPALTREGVSSRRREAVGSMGKGPPLLPPPTVLNALRRPFFSASECGTGMSHEEHPHDPRGPASRRADGLRGACAGAHAEP